MANPVITFAAKLVRKLIVSALIACLALVAYSLWVYTRDAASFEERRSQMFATLTSERAIVEAKLQEAVKKQNDTAKALAIEQQRSVQADKTLKTLHELDAGAIDRLFGDADEQKKHTDRIARLEKLKADSQTNIVNVQRESVLGEDVRESLAIRKIELEQEESALRRDSNPVAHYARSAWTEAGWLIELVFFGYLLGGFIGALVLYYGWSKWVGRGRLLKLETESEVPPTIGESALTVEDSVWPGEVLWVRRGYLYSNEDGLTQRSRFVLNWSAPFSWMFGGLCRLIELRNGRSDGDRRVIFANSVSPFAELAVVSVPENGSLVIRATHVLGLIASAQSTPPIRRHWALFRWQSWISAQFGYLEFFGPCRLVVSGISALRAEVMTAADGGKLPVGYTSQAGLVAFSPRLGLKPVRRVGFWRYCRGLAPLFEVQLTGAGVFVTRDMEEHAGTRNQESFSAQVRKLFGL
ncbi:MAG: hypothetical protein WC205_14535 [Opitutaceae bacterium]|jgi:hypothetical protein